MRHTKIFEPIRNGVRGEPYPIMNEQHKNATQKWDIIEKYVNFEGKKVLDIGTSEGYGAIEAVELGAEFVVGIDNVQWLLEVAEKAKEQLGILDDKLWFEKIDFLETSGQTFEALWGGFDITLCLGVIHHFPMFRYGRQLKDICDITKQLLVLEMWVDVGKLGIGIREEHRSWINVIPSEGWLNQALDRFGFKPVKKVAIYGKRRELWVCVRKD